MKKPRVSTLIIIAQFLLFLTCLGFLGYYILANWVSGNEAKDFAYQAGSAEAMRNYLRGHYSVYEMKLYKYSQDTGPIPNDGTTEPADKTEGRFPVYYYLVSEDAPKVYRAIHQQFIDGYNSQMHAYFEHPELFDNNGLRIPMRELHSHTNVFNLTQ